MDALSCSLCVKDGKTVNSVKFCVECNNQLCSSCLNQHNRFDAMKGHQLVEQDKGIAGGAASVKAELPTQRCPEHHGKLVDMYCEFHDAVCCVACVAVYHNTCKNIAYLPQVATSSIITNELIETVKERILNLQVRLDALKPGKQQDAEKLNAEKETILKSIKEIRKMAEDHFDALEKQIVEILDSKVTATFAEISSDVAQVEGMIVCLKKETGLLQEQKAGKNSSSLFAQMKMTTTQEQRGLLLEKTIQSKPKKSLEIVKDLKVYTMLDEISVFGKIFENFFIVDDFSVTEGTVKGKDKSVCDVTSACALHDGSVIVADLKHESVKKLVKGYCVQKLELSGPPLGVSALDSNTAIACLLNKQKVSIVCTLNLKVKQKLYTGKSCRGVANNNGLLFLTGGGMEEGNEGPGFVAVYQIITSIVTTPGHSTDTTYSITQKAIFEKQLKFPHQIAASRDGSVVYIADAKLGLVTMTKYGRILSIFTHPEMDTPVGVCQGPQNRLFLCGLKSNNVMVLTQSGELIKTILTERDGVQNPSSLCFDEARQELTVTMSKSDKVKIVTFKHA